MDFEDIIEEGGENEEGQVQNNDMFMFGMDDKEIEELK